MKLYTYQQSDDDIKLWFSFGDDCTRDDVKITVSDVDIKVKYKEQQLLSGKLFHVVEGDLTTWSVENNRYVYSLCILFVKRKLKS